MQENLVSIIIPCYNQSRFLDDSLGSVLKQTFSNWECIIVDDGSQDNTKEIAALWCKKDKRFSYFYQKNQGLSAARNAGLKKATGNYIQFLDADDFLDTKKIERSLDLIKNRDANLVVSGFKVFDNQSSEYQEPFCELKQDILNFQAILFEWDRTFNIPIHCGFFSKEILRGIKFNAALKSKEDWIFWLELLLKNDVQPIYLDENLAFYRMHPDSLSRNTENMRINSIKARELLPEIISQKDCIDFFLEELNRKDLRISQLQNHIWNIQKSRSFKLVENLKRFFKLDINRDA